MRYMAIYRPGTDGGPPPTPQEMAAMGEFVAEMTQSGVLLASGGLQESATGAKVTIRDGGEFTVIDGPFTETKELVGGFAILEARSKAHAVDLVKRFLRVAGAGECEVRPMFEGPDVGCPAG